MVLGNKDEERIKWAKSFTSGKKWFLKLIKQHGDKEGTRKNYALALERFSEYMKMSPDEIIKNYEESLDENTRKAVEEWNDNLDLFVPWIIEKYGLSRSRAKDHFAGVKSFFDNNVSIKLTAKTPSAHAKEKLPTSLDDIRDKILPHADIQETFIVLFLKDSGISQAEVLRLNVGDVEDIGEGFGYLRVFREKENVDYETFIGPNATKAMKQYLEYRRREGENVTDTSPLFIKKKKLGQRLSRSLISWQLLELGKKAGVELSTHRLRKCFETYLALGRVHPLILKYWMGHKVKGGRDVEARYIIPPTQKQKEAYMEAYEHIDISGKSLAEMKRRQEISEELTTKLMNGEQFTETDRQNMKRYNIKLRERAKSQKAANNPGCTDGKHCPVFKEINESELVGHLNEGWAIAHNLQNGQIIIQREE